MIDENALRQKVYLRYTNWLCLKQSLQSIQLEA